MANKKNDQKLLTLKDLEAAKISQRKLLASKGADKGKK